MDSSAGDDDDKNPSLEDKQTWGQFITKVTMAGLGYIVASAIVEWLVERVMKRMKWGKYKVDADGYGNVECRGG